MVYTMLKKYVIELSSHHSPPQPVDCKKGLALVSSFKFSLVPFAYGSLRVHLVLDIRFPATLHFSRVIQFPMFRAPVRLRGIASRRREYLSPDLGRGWY